MLYPEKQLGGGTLFPGQNPGLASDCGPTPWSSVRSNLMTEPHNSALAPLIVPIHCQSVPNTRTRKARGQSQSETPNTTPLQLCWQADEGQRQKGILALWFQGAAPQATKREQVGKWCAHL